MPCTLLQECLHGGAWSCARDVLDLELEVIFSEMRRHAYSTSPLLPTIAVASNQPRTLVVTAHHFDLQQQVSATRRSEHGMLTIE